MSVRSARSARSARYVRRGRHDTSAGSILQTLPKIKNPLPPTGSLNQSDGTNYVGGQSLKLKNAVGPNLLSVVPAGGDTVDYGLGPINVAPGGCLVLEADGISNWLIISRL